MIVPNPDSFHGLLLRLNYFQISLGLIPMMRQGTSFGSSAGMPPFFVALQARIRAFRMDLLIGHSWLRKAVLNGR